MTATERTAYAEGVGAGRSSSAAVLRLLRPKQWTKSVLVLAAPGAAGVLLDPATFWRVAVALVGFCLLSSAVYVLNDAVDAPADRLHPVKKRRPLASGEVTLPVATAVGGLLVAAGLAAAAATGLPVVAVFVVYAANSVAYSLWLKRVAAVELVAVAAGFVLRALAGAEAARVPVSNWFLIVTSFGALFVVAGKRHGEIVRLDGLVGTRVSLQEYTVAYLRGVSLLAAAVATTGYCLWAAEEGAGVAHPVTYQLSVLPFVLALLRYSLLVERGQGGEPEEVFLADRPLQVLGVLWVLVFGAGVLLR
ncbi:MAG: decaprenyl-phosphate phosphoribosyltransferase [Nocardioidaceae bacterium]